MTSEYTTVPGVKDTFDGEKHRANEEITRSSTKLSRLLPVLECNLCIWVGQCGVCTLGGCIIKVARITWADAQVRSLWLCPGVLAAKPISIHCIINAIQGSATTVLPPLSFAILLGCLTCPTSRGLLLDRTGALSYGFSLGTRSLGSCPRFLPIERSTCHGTGDLLDCLALNV